MYITNSYNLKNRKNTAYMPKFEKVKLDWVKLLEVIISEVKLSQKMVTNFLNTV